MNRLIIDGYNLLNCGNLDIPLNLELETQRDYLIRQLQNYAATQNCHITVVFDNRQRSASAFSPAKLLKIIFSSPGKEADDVIRKMVRKSKAPAKLTVVTSDRVIRMTAKDHGVSNLTSEEFGRMICKNSTANSSNKKFQQTKTKFQSDLSDAEVDYWKTLFENRDDKD